MEVVVENISKSLDEEFIFQDISFHTSPGKVTGILGLQETGKTTLLRIILNIVRPDSGKVLFNDKQMNPHVRKVIGYLPQQRGIFQKQKLLQVLSYYGQLKNMSWKKAHVESIRLLDRFDMIEYLDSPVELLSPNLQQRLYLLVSILNNPQLLILDEPFLGMDPLNQNLLQKTINQFRGDGKNIIIATKQFNEAEKLCDDILFLYKGKIELNGSIEKVRDNFRAHLVIVETDNNLRILRNIKGVKKFLIEKQTAKLFVDDKIPQKEILQEIINTVNASKIEVKRPSLNDIFNDVIQNEN
jgi:ABC-2 type transport system ATP-binding protein